MSSVPSRTGGAPSEAPAIPPPGGRLRRLLLGRPLPSYAEREERLSKPMALAILSSDALSSVAYATEEMLRVLLPAAGVAAFSLSLPVGGAIIALLLLLTFSYRQTIQAYPSAGGAYIVTRDNFGVLPAQFAGVALLLDYIMTVAVSIAAAVAALYSYFPGLFPYRLPIAVALIWMVTWGNLRGLRATGKLFAAPTYLFLASIGSLVAAGLVAALRGHLHALPPPPGETLRTTGTVGWLLILHAYASGTTALTGVEAISNGVSVFRPVEWRNARRVLMWMGAILAVSFGSITVLAWKLHPVPTDQKTLVSEVGAALFGHGTAGHLALLILQVATTLILVLAANTSFSDFPRLASFHAGDGYLPRPLRRRGSRLVFSTGILVLATLATTVVLVVGADVHRLIPLYAVGVFASFTFSQAGMTRRHWRLRERGWRRGLAINAAGSAGSGLALVTILVSKFTHGAWAVAIIVPVGVGLFVAIHRHYERADAWLAAPGTGRAIWQRVRVLVATDRHHVALADAAASYARRVASRDEAMERVVGRREARSLLDETGDATLTLLVLPHWPVSSGALRGAWRRVAAVPRLADERLRRTALRHDDTTVASLTLERGGRVSERDRHIAIVVVGRPDGLARRGLAVANALGADEVHALHVEVDPEETTAVLEEWSRSDLGIEPEVIPAPYREPGGPLKARVEELHRGTHAVTSVIAPALALRWWQRLLYANSTRALRKALAGTGTTALIECRLSLATGEPVRERIRASQR
ncbi:MAG TPA: APC family permease [Actinomycetota bacterium]|nr:APC family permease [Actinomycetota bacterium]